MKQTGTKTSTSSAMKLVGKIKEAHGLKGEVYVLVFSGDITWMSKLKTFGLGILPPQGQEPPAHAVTQTLTCQRAKPFKKGLILKAQELNDRNASEAVEQLGFYIPAEFLVSEEGDSIYLEEVLGFSVVDSKKLQLGEIVGFSSNGVQDLLVLDLPSGGSAEVPFVDAFIQKIDFENKTVIMDLPDGLLELSAVEAVADDGQDDGDSDDHEEK